MNEDDLSNGFQKDQESSPESEPQERPEIHIENLTLTQAIGGNVELEESSDGTSLPEEQGSPTYNLILDQFSVHQSVEMGEEERLEQFFKMENQVRLMQFTEEARVSQHPYRHLLYSKSVTFEDLMKLIRQLQVYLSLPPLIVTHLRSGFDIKIGEKKNALFLDLDETLIFSVPSFFHYHTHSTNIGKDITFFILRPFAQEFIYRMAQIYDVYIYTSSHEDYALPIVEAFDQDNLIIEVLTRRHCYVNGQFIIKDLNFIQNRSINSMILVDDQVLAHLLSNTIPIMPFLGSKKDYELPFLADYLTTICEEDNLRATLQQHLKLNVLMESCL